MAESAPNYPPPQADTTADVIVLGAGLAGLATVYALLSGGLPAQRMILLNPKGDGRSRNGRPRATVAPAFWQPYNRLKTSMQSNAARLLQFGAASASRLQHILSRAPDSIHGWIPGVLQMAATDFELHELHEAVDLLQTDGYAAEMLAPEQAQAHLGFRPQRPCAYDANGGSFIPATLLPWMIADVVAQGVHVHQANSVQRLSGHNDGTVAVAVNGITLRSECMVLAFETDPATISSSLQSFVGTRKQRPFAYHSPNQNPRPTLLWNRHLNPSQADVHPYEAHAQPAALITADGLPLIGANPFGSDEILCLAFQGWSGTFAWEAGQLVAELLLDGRSAHADLFNPLRLL